MVFFDVLAEHLSATITPQSSGVLIASVPLSFCGTPDPHELSRSFSIPQALIATVPHAMCSDSIPMTSATSLRPTGFAETILIATILLGVLCVIAVVLRTWQRLRDKTFHVDDAVTWLGLVSQHMVLSEHHFDTDTQKIFTLVQYAVVVWGTIVGIGSPDSIGAIMQTGSVQAMYCKPPGTSKLAQQTFVSCSLCNALT